MQREVNFLLRLYLRYIDAGSLISPIRIPLIGRLTIAHTTPNKGFAGPGSGQNVLARRPPVIW